MSRWNSRTDQENDKWVDVWIDGSCPGNGLYVDYGGIGIFWGDKHPWNVSERAIGRTNECCEIEAAICAIQIARDNSVMKLRINTNSDFLIHSVYDWIPVWKNNRWKTSDGSDVKYKNELMDLVYEMNGPTRVFWHHVSTHAGGPGAYGIDMADKLARKGARN